MGARSLVLLDRAFPCQLPDAPATFAEILMFTAFVTMRIQAVYEAPIVAEQVPFLASLVLDGPGVYGGRVS